MMPSEHYPEVFGGEMSDTCEFASLDEANEILGLMMRHWNTIAGTLFKGEVYVPLLLEDEDGTAQGNDWARGFIAGHGHASRYFREHRQVKPSAHASEPRRNAPKVGRNEPCPCGSGKKYKRCCGGARVN